MDPMEAMYPRSMKLGLKPVGEGFDSLELKKALGPERFNALMKGVESVFCCNHAKYPEGHDMAGHEVHCVYARDLEKFLEAESCQH